MSDQNVTQKRIGRPPGRVHTHMMYIRASDEFLRLLDDWRESRMDRPSRSAAIRELIERGIATDALGG